MSRSVIGVNSSGSAIVLSLGVAAEGGLVGPDILDRDRRVPASQFLHKEAAANYCPEGFRAALRAHPGAVVGSQRRHDLAQHRLPTSPMRRVSRDASATATEGDGRAVLAR